MDHTESSPDKQQMERHVFAAVQTIGDGLILVDRHNRVTYMNPTAERLTGWLLQDALGKPGGLVFYIVNAVTREAEWQPVIPTMEDNRPYLLLPNSRLICKDGTEVAVEDTVSPMNDPEGNVIGATILFRDVGQNRATLLRVLERVQRDLLTNLPNRGFFEESLSTLHAHENSYALLYLDFDNFKKINDTWGHLAGDFTLQVLARRIRESTPPTSTVCRWGGDEFVVLLRDIQGKEEVGAVEAQLQLSVAEPIRWEGVTIHARVSVGIAFGTEGKVGELLEIADRAMYRAKRASQELSERNQVQTASVSSLGRTTDLRSDEQPSPEMDIVLHYQPIVELATGSIVGAEALARTQRGQGAVSLPAELIRNAERDGTIVRLGRLVLKQALRQQAIWRHAGHHELCMNVNVSAIELLDPAYLHHLDRILEEESYTPSQVTIELTESALLHSEQQRLLVKAMTERGLRIAIDDFGVGYSNLSYLRKIPIDIIKIDRDFVRSLPGSRQEVSLVKAMIAMAQSLHCAVIAEGIETEAQKQLLWEMQCSQGQGFLFSPAVPPERFWTLLQDAG